MPVEATPTHVGDGPVRRAYFTFGVGYDMADRWFRHHEPTTGEDRPYSATLLSGVALSGELYPLAGSEGIIGDFGVTFEFAKTANFQSLPYPQGGSAAQTDVASATVHPVGLPTLNTSFTRWGVGLRYRIGSILNPLRRWEIGVGAGYRQWSFDFPSTTDPTRQIDSDRELPRAGYKQIRAVADVRARFGWFGLFGSLAYLQLIHIDPLGNRTAAGLAAGPEATFGPAVYFTDWFSFELYARYMFAYYRLHALPGRRTDAQGIVLDHFLDLYAGPRIAF
jgi:hypothetical protein